MPKKPAPARRLAAADMTPKAKAPKAKKGLVLRGKSRVIPHPTLDRKGIPTDPHPHTPTPVRSLTARQMAKEARGIAELQPSRKDR